MNFFQRNKSIFIFGLIIGIAFIGIIVLGWRHANDNTLVLTPFDVAEEEQKPTDYEYKPPEGLFKPTEESETEKPKVSTDQPAEGVIKTPEEDPEPVTQRPTKEVLFTIDGFKPRTEEAHVGQAVRWINSTEEQITIKELLNPQSDQTPIIINPGETFEFITKKSGFWTFKELNSGEAARFYIGGDN